MDLATVALVVSITNGISALTLRIIKLNDRRRARTYPRNAQDASTPGDAGP
jgi:hypothetical protein